MAATFETRCKRVAEATGIGVTFYDDAGRDRVFEDDGCLHVARGALRACFDVGAGQSCTTKQQNENTIAVLTSLGMRRFVADALVEKSDDDERIT